MVVAFRERGRLADLGIGLRGDLQQPQMLITVVGIGMVALPTSILASGYSQQLKIRERKYQNRADAAWDDGVLDDDEIRDLEELRIKLGIGRHTASQILDERMVSAALKEFEDAGCCPNCGKKLPGAA